MRKLPENLHAAYNWTEAAGQLDELRGLEGEALDTYCRESAENARENEAHDVTATDLALLREWLTEGSPAPAPLATEAELSEARAVEFGDIEDYYDGDEIGPRVEAWGEASKAWYAARDAACEAAERGNLVATLKALVAMRRVEIDWGDDPSTQQVVDALALHVEGGDTAEDYDHGTVVRVTLYDEAVVAWRQSPSRTEAPIAVLRPYSKDGAGRFLVTIEEMPDHHRESHRAARNWGVYPQNGATRRRVTPGEAEEIIEADQDGYAHIVEG